MAPPVLHHHLSSFVFPFSSHFRPPPLHSSPTPMSPPRVWQWQRWRWNGVVAHERWLHLFSITISPRSSFLSPPMFAPPPSILRQRRCPRDVVAHERWRGMAALSPRSHSLTARKSCCTPKGLAFRLRRPRGLTPPPPSPLPPSSFPVNHVNYARVLRLCQERREGKTLIFRSSASGLR